VLKTTSDLNRFRVDFNDNAKFAGQLGDIKSVISKDRWFESTFFESQIALTKDIAIFEKVRKQISSSSWNPKGASWRKLLVDKESSTKKVQPMIVTVLEEFKLNSLGKRAPAQETH
jgi:hypothetical protein